LGRYDQIHYDNEKFYSLNTKLTVSCYLQKLIKDYFFYFIAGFKDYFSYFIACFLVLLFIFYGYYVNKAKSKLLNNAKSISNSIINRLQNIAQEDTNFLTIREIQHSYNLKEKSKLWQLIKQELSKNPHIQSMESMVNGCQLETWRYKIAPQNQPPLFSKHNPYE